MTDILQALLYCFEELAASDEVRKGNAFESRPHVFLPDIIHVNGI